MRRPWWLVLLLALGCGPESNSLSGSLETIYPLAVSRATIAQNDEALQVTYLRNRGVFLDVVARVSVSLKYCSDDGDGGVSCGFLALQPGAKLDLAGDYEPNHPRTVVAYAPGGEPVRLLPRVRRGDMVINSVTTFDPDGGLGHGQTKGSFAILFESQGGDIGFGRTLNGLFSVVATDAGFGLP